MSENMFRFRFIVLSVVAFACLAISPNVSGAPDKEDHPKPESSKPKTKPWEPKMLPWGTPIREATVLVKGGSLYYKVVGRGQPILIVHGGPGMDQRYLYPHLNELAKEYRLIFYDQRGTGASRCKIDEKSVTIDQFADDIDSIRRHLGLRRLNLLGHSWGGLLSLYYASRHPKNVRSLMLIDSAAITTMSFQDFLNNLEKRRTEDDRAQMKAIEDTVEYQRGDPDARMKFGSISAKPYYYDIANIERLQYAPSPLTIQNGEQIRKYFVKFWQNYDLRPAAARIRAPTLVLHADKDPIPLDAAEEIHKAIPKSKYVVLEDAGHYSFIENPEDFMKEVLDFLKSVKGP